MDNVVEQQSVRFSDAPWYSARNRTPIVFGGAGGIGSWTALILTKLGFNLRLYDMDNVEIINTGPQVFPRSEINRNKAIALQHVCHYFSTEGQIYTRGQYINTSETGPYMICGFDNMAARKLMFTNWKTHIASGYTQDQMKPIFIDGRMLAEQYQVFFIQGHKPENIKRYEEEFLFDDSEVEKEQCSFKSTTHFCAGIAHEICTGFTNHLSNWTEQDDMYEVPFRVEKYGPSFNLIVE